MLHTIFIGAKFIGLIVFVLIALHECNAAVDRWCDFCEGLWDRYDELKESPDNS